MNRKPSKIFSARVVDNGPSRSIIQYKAKGGHDPCNICY